MDYRHYDHATTTTPPSRPAARDRGSLLHTVPGTAQTREDGAAGSRFRAGLWLAARVLGALALLVTGAVHLQQYLQLYAAIPTIGTLFLLNFAGASLIGLALLAPLQRVARALGRFLLAPLALAGIALSAVAFAFLLISENMPLFGFQEPGYSPAAIMAVQSAEIATVLFLGAFLIGRVGLKARMVQW